MPPGDRFIRLCSDHCPVVELVTTSVHERSERNAPVLDVQISQVAKAVSWVHYGHSETAEVQVTGRKSKVDSLFVGEMV